MSMGATGVYPVVFQIRTSICNRAIR